MKPRRLFFIHAALIAASVTLTASACTKKLSVAFYDLTEKTQTALEERIAALLTDKNGAPLVRFETLDPALPLAPQIKGGLDMVFTPNGSGFLSIAETASGLDKTMLRSMPSSMGYSGIVFDTLRALPILLDHCEIAYYTNYISGSIPPRSMEALLAFAGSGQTAFYPILCAGGNDSELLLFISSMTESFLGQDAYAKLIKLIASKPSFESILNAQLSDEGQGLRHIIDTLAAWRSKGLLHPSWYDASTQDVQAFMELKFVPVVIMSLAAHRTMPASLVNRYEASWFPAARNDIQRSLVVPAVMGVCLTANKSDNGLNAENVIRHLISEATQKHLSSVSGLAPVHSTAEAVDKQASNVRLWAASSDRLLYSLMDAFAAPKDAVDFAHFIRMQLKKAE